jgi:hypothetical protein
MQPSSQPSMQPSSQPSMQPSNQPSTRPTYGSTQKSVINSEGESLQLMAATIPGLQMLTGCYPH